MIKILLNLVPCILKYVIRLRDLYKINIQYIHFNQTSTRILGIVIIIIFQLLVLSSIRLIASPNATGAWLYVLKLNLAKDLVG